MGNKSILGSGKVVSLNNCEAFVKEEKTKVGLVGLSHKIGRIRTKFVEKLCQYTYVRLVQKIIPKLTNKTRTLIEDGISMMRSIKNIK